MVIAIDSNSLLGERSNTFNGLRHSLGIPAAVLVLGLELPNWYLIEFLNLERLKKCFEACPKDSKLSHKLLRCLVAKAATTDERLLVLRCIQTATTYDQGENPFWTKELRDYRKAVYSKLGIEAPMERRWDQVIDATGDREQIPALNSILSAATSAQVRATLLSFFSPTSACAKHILNYTATAEGVAGLMKLCSLEPWTSNDAILMYAIGVASNEQELYMVRDGQKLSPDHSRAMASRWSAIVSLTSAQAA